MSWTTNVERFGHRMFIAFIELKIEGSWSPRKSVYVTRTINYELLEAMDEHCSVQLIEPDGLRRHLEFAQSTTIGINQNILSYDPSKAEEITVDEKEQSGKGKTREIL